jgi:WD40 repeat protein/DNA-binding SARP family transcriptional activator
MARLIISLFGQFEVRLDRQPLTGFQSDKSRSLLAYLAVEADRPLRRELLATLFWPDASDQTARTNLRSALLNLRQVLGDSEARPHFLIIARESIQFNRESDALLDVTEFNRLQAAAAEMQEDDPAARIETLKSALALYRGNFLDGLTVKDCPSFDEWCYNWRERLHISASAALWQIGEYYDRVGDYETAIQYARRRVELEPWLEEAHYHLMRLLALNGERTSALAQYDACCRQLKDHLEIKPTAEIERLYELIRDGRLGEINRSIGDLLPAPGESPFKGLQFFNIGDAGLFFGREAMTARLAEHLRQMQALPQNKNGQGKGRLLAVVGASGSGKSSLVRAGLAALVKRGQLGEPSLRGSPWAIHIVTPGSHPLAVLNSLESDPNRPSLLVVDQFEEIFTLCRSEAETREFIERLLKREELVVITLRADFYVNCAQYPALREALSKRQEYLGAMSIQELRRAIEEPAQRNGWELERGLVDLILRDLGASPNHGPEPGALPLLSHALLETWQRRSGHHLTLKGYEEAGSISGVIAKTAESVFAGLDSEQQDVTRRIFLRLTDLGEATQDTRRRASLDELIPAGANRETTLEAVRRLATARLLVTERNPVSGEEEVEMAHEALIRHWPRLRGWLEEDRAELRLGERVRDAARDWHSSGRADNLLVHRGERLEAAIQAAYSRRLIFNQDELDYLNACRSQVERERVNVEHRRNLVIFTSIGVALIMGLIAILGLNQAERTRRQAEISLAQQLAAQADEMLSQPALNDTALLLTIESIRHFPDRNANEILANSLSLFPQTVAKMEHNGQVTCLALSADGKWIASGSLDATVRVWNEHSGEEVVRLLQGSPVSSVAISPDGHLVAAGGKDGIVRVWDVVHAHELAHMVGKGAVWSVAFSPDGSKLAAGGEDGTARLWEVGGWQELAKMTHEGIVYTVKFSPNGKRLLTASQDGTAGVWSTSDGQELLRIKNNSELWTADYSPVGLSIVTAGWDGVVRVWDAQTGAERAHMLNNDAVRAVAFNPDGIWLATASDDGTARVWDVENGRELARMQHAGRVLSIAFSPDGQRVVSGSEDGTARVWEADTGREISSMQHHAAVTAVTFSRDGASVISGSFDATVKIWRAEAGRELARMLQDARISSVSFSPDGSEILSSSDDSTARIWNPQSESEVARMLHGGGVFSAAFSPDGKLAISGSSDSAVRIWLTANGQEVNRLKHYATVWAVAFSPDGKQILSGSQDNLVRIWDLKSGKELRRMSHTGPVFSVAFSPDGKQAASASQDQTVRVWDVASGQELLRLTLNGPVNVVRFSQDGKLLACGDQTGMVWVWEISANGGKAKQVDSLKHDGAVASLAFSPNGQWLISGSQDQTARIWELQTRREVARIKFDEPVSAVAFSPDGKRLILGTEDGILRVWLWQDADLVQLACSRLERNLSQAEWKQYMGDRPYQSTCPNLPPGN